MLLEDKMMRILAELSWSVKWSGCNDSSYAWVFSENVSVATNLDLFLAYFRISTVLDRATIWELHTYRHHQQQT